MSAGATSSIDQENTRKRSGEDAAKTAVINTPISCVFCIARDGFIAVTSRPVLFGRGLRFQDPQNDVDGLEAGLGVSDFAFGEDHDRGDFGNREPPGDLRIGVGIDVRGNVVAIGVIGYGRISPDFRLHPAARRAPVGGEV